METVPLAGNPRVRYVTAKATGFVSRVNDGNLLRTPLNINWQKNNLCDDILA